VRCRLVEPLDIEEPSLQRDAAVFVAREIRPILNDALKPAGFAIDRFDDPGCEASHLVAVVPMLCRHNSVQDRACCRAAFHRPFRTIRRRASPVAAVAPMLCQKKCDQMQKVLDRILRPVALRSLRSRRRGDWSRQMAHDAMHYADRCRDASPCVRSTSSHSRRCGNDDVIEVHDTFTFVRRALRS
jgi:hypothetical protein